MNSFRNGEFVSAGAKLSFSEAGDGLPVVLLHPTPLDREYWRPMVRELAGIRIVVPDLRGHGKSELGIGLPTGAFSRVPTAPVLTMTQLAADIVALLDTLKISKAVFGGCSIGGYVMLELWRRAPQRIRGMMFVCSKPQPDSEANLAKRMETIAQARADGVAALFDGMAQNTVAPSVKRERPEVVAEVRAQMTLTVEAEVAVQAGLAARPDSVPTVATIRVPVLAIAGAEDANVTEKDMEAFKAAPGGCELHVVPAAGHYAAYEQPKKVAALMAPWLRQFS
ncbi:MAG TPA: alpha/beta fold hydrolase [Terracidiphilus sp.]|nr:alpha/beta fold hydrolase [Terracidiphilus sp.]